jgi:hypothetical protein
MRRLAYRLSTMPRDRANDLRAQFHSAGIDTGPISYETL